MARLFPKTMAPNRASKLENVTLRNFGGGWNAVANDDAMPNHFQPALVNFHRNASNGQVLRYGSAWFADLINTLTGDTIVDMEYFISRIIAVSNTGQIAAVNDAGVAAKIWDTAIAAALPGAPTGWGSTFETLDFVSFKNQLVIHNGVDKPIVLSDAYAVTYLQDLSTGSNINVPIGKYGCVVSNYHCVAGIAAAPTTIYISSKGTAGVFPGDPAPNDALSIDVGAYAPEGAPEIIGIAGFRSNLIVMFVGQSLVIKLGNYNEDGVHVPEFPDALPKFGLVSHRCIVKLVNDITFSGLAGVSSAKRNILSGLLDSKYLSEVIAPAYRKAIGTLSLTDRKLQCFAVYDPLEYTTEIYTPNRVFVYTNNEELHYSGWSEYTGRNWQCACTSELGRVFGADGMRIYQHGNRVFEGEDYHADKQNDRLRNWSALSVFSAGNVIYDTDEEQSYICLVPHKSGSGTFAEDRDGFPDRWAVYEGEEIEFTMELPWIDGKDPMKVKHLRFASASTNGTAEFTLEFYVDKIHNFDVETLYNLVDADGSLLIDMDGALLIDPALSLVSPALSVNMIGNDAQGFGYDAGPFGGGRRSNDPRLMGFPVKFKTLKPRIIGATRKPLEINTLSFLFARGKYTR